MSDREFLGDRKKALEDSFFAKQNQRLLEKMREEQRKKEAREALQQATGLSDAEVLGRLVDLGIGADTWAALSLVPLVEVAWADGVLDPKERRAVLSGAEAHGVIPGSASHELLQSWLERRPGPELLQAWGEYMVGVSGALSESERRALKEQILGLARGVAESAGGLLGLKRISVEEERVLAELEKVFSSP